MNNWQVSTENGVVTMSNFELAQQIIEHYQDAHYWASRWELSNLKLDKRSKEYKNNEQLIKLKYGRILAYEAVLKMLGYRPTCVNLDTDSRFYKYEWSLVPCEIVNDIKE